jgi:hypothetical protein
MLPRRDLELAIATRPDDIEEDKWNFMTQFQNMIKKLKEKYSRTTVSDISEVRIKISKLTDQGTGGFYEYRSKFTELANELSASGVAGAASPAELREWAKSGIKNKKVFDAVIAPMFLNTPECTAEQLFDKISKYLTLCVQADNDPYKQVTAPEGKVSVNAVTQGTGKQSHSSQYNSSTKLCTRCWRSGHRFPDCRTSKCGAPGCFTEIPADKSSCPNWRQHKDSSHRFRDNIAPWEKNNKSGKKQFSKKDKDNSRGGKRNRDGKFKRGPGKQSSAASTSGGGAGESAATDDDEPSGASSGRKSALSSSKKRSRVAFEEDEST